MYAETKEGINPVLAFLGLIVFAALAALLPISIAIPILLAFGLIYIAWTAREPLFYIAVFLIPYVGIVLYLADIPSLASIPIIGSWDAPLSDFIALLLVIVYGWHMIKTDRVQKIHHHLRDHLPGIRAYAPFLIVAALTVFRAPEALQSTSAHYLLRFVLFSYIAYVALPYWAIRNKSSLHTVIRVFVWSGIFAALYGAISLFVNQPFWGIWHRVQPFAIDGFAPLGLNHNLLAEVLVVVLPLTLWMGFNDASRWRVIYKLAGVGIILVTLLTFGRTAWIVLVIQTLAFLWLVRPSSIMSKVVRLWPALVIITILIGYMSVFSGSAFVAESTKTRIDLTRFALTQAASTPLFGAGIGTFLPAIGESRVFILEYGAGIEAHGFIQKLLYETGVVGTFLFIAFFVWLLMSLSRAWHRTAQGRYRDLLLAAFLMVLGAIVFQVFNVSYFNAKLWFPVGLALVILQGKWKFSKQL